MARSKKRQNRNDEPQRPRGRRAPIIELNDVTKVYPGGHVALDRVSLAIDRGEFVFLVGPTGCGKSTLIKMLIRELAASEGSVMIAGRDIGALSEKKIPQLRRNIGTVFQDFKLLPDRTVYDNVAYALQVIGASRAEIREQVPRDAAPGRALDQAPQLPRPALRRRAAARLRRPRLRQPPAAAARRRAQRQPRPGHLDRDHAAALPDQQDRHDRRRRHPRPRDGRQACAAAWSSSTRAASSATRSAAATPRSRRPSSACGCGPRWGSAPKARADQRPRPGLAALMSRLIFFLRRRSAPCAATPPRAWPRS